jgi:tetratricopeptide (TPR) repeat protein
MSTKIVWQFLTKTYALHPLLFSALGNIDTALGFYENYYMLMKELYVGFPTNVLYKNNLAISYSKLGETHTDLGNLDTALRFYEKDIALSKELHADFPTNVAYKNGLAVSFYKLGAFNRDKLTDKTQARVYFQQAESLWKELVHDAPMFVQFQKNLGVVQKVLADL